MDVVPILYNGDSDWYGDLVSQDDGTFLKTCIPRHLEFIRKRKTHHEMDFAQVIRLGKYWIRKLKRENEDFRFKSFMVELIFAHLADGGRTFSDYPDALQHFFTYLATSRLRDPIVFTDYYGEAAVEEFHEPILILDPVNPENNVARLYTETQADAIVEAAMDAGDAIDAALYAPTKHETVSYWQKVFGSAFQM